MNAGWWTVGPSPRGRRADRVRFSTNPTQGGWGDRPRERNVPSYSFGSGPIGPLYRCHGVLVVNWNRPAWWRADTRPDARVVTCYRRTLCASPPPWQVANRIVAQRCSLAQREI